ncbi:zinc finger protein 98-like [Condylostylus longicornis]|uniref:zinc finger protein 98-like n=1 Tax=Condylostylus longicornis TaxID=2530218 RepID=UPI00244E1773|nr:zinc finger protein 98-like [Condylostylus longicornis]
MTENITNCCAMCLLDRGTDFLDLFKDTENGRIVNKYGKMYEDLLNIKIDNQYNFPDFICSSCSLQLQLSINLKQKALESFYKIVSLNDQILNDIKMEKNFIDSSNSNENDSSDLADNSTNLYDNTVIQMDYIEEVIDKEDNSVDSYCSNSNKNTESNSYIDDGNPEFLDVQFLKEEYEDELDNRENEELLEFSSFDTNETRIESENEEIFSLTVNENDIKHKSTLNNINNSFVFNNDHKMNNIKIPNSKLKNNSKNTQNIKKRTKFICDLCSRVSYSKEAFEVHKKVHAGLPAFKCEICGKNFKQKVHYNIHMMNHTNERNYECSECEKKFKTKSDLRIHFQIHTGERRYVCDICNKAYRAHSHMKNHRYTHFEKQLECQICKQKYISPATLKTHIKTIHEMTTPQHECVQCHKKFKRKHHLQVHLKTHNKDKQGDLFELTYIKEIS